MTKEAGKREKLLEFKMSMDVDSRHTPQCVDQLQARMEDLQLWYDRSAATIDGLRAEGKHGVADKVIVVVNDVLEWAKSAVFFHNQWQHAIHQIVAERGEMQGRGAANPSMLKSELTCECYVCALRRLERGIDQAPAGPKPQ